MTNNNPFRRLVHFQSNFTKLHSFTLKLMYSTEILLQMSITFGRFVNTFEKSELKLINSWKRWQGRRIFLNEEL